MRPERSLEDLCRQLEQTNALLAQQVDLARNWRIALRNGVAAGLGGVIGATLVVSVLLGVLKPLQGLERLAPVLEKLERDLEKR